MSRRLQRAMLAFVLVSVPVAGLSAIGRTAERPDGETRSAAGGGGEWRGAAKRVDITPPTGLPLWGYGGRKDLPAAATRESLTATAVVLESNGERIAIVALDLGRSPARATVDHIRAQVRERAKVDQIFLVASHTHHGPCVEIETSTPTAEYVAELKKTLVAVIVDAAGALEPVRIRVARREVDFNRNRHTKISPKPVDRELIVCQIDALNGGSVATLVNFAAHPTTIPALELEWSPDYVGALRRTVESEIGGRCAFLQGACGDLSTQRRGKDTRAYGDALGRVAVALVGEARSSSPSVAAGLDHRAEEFQFGLRVDLSDPIVYAKYCLAFFPALVDAYRDEYTAGMRPNITVALLGGRVGIVGASGEFFSAHALRLRERARLDHVLFLGYCNGYHQYFPTIEAVAEGGYGADRDVSPAEIGAGERMMDRALFHLFDLRTSMATRER